ncbi:transmembrane protease serine 9 isoform X1 [Lates calcarifer]|uniref:Transmembrane protease serine 9 isoform X1 n=1 Tax=Lates calcarifer TaxID=8187 RepID=A0AAJ7VBK0_LATCA|nr:transmembrane protease serine 9 isoform X1 [Lates calcarifer]
MKATDLLSVCLLLLQTAGFSLKPSNTTDHHNNNNNNNNNNHTAAAAAGLNLNHLNVTINGSFSEHFGFSDLAGVRSFSPEQEMESRIIGGQEAWAHSWPWQVSLRFATMPACGGAIISPLWVISAAHCFKRYNKASFWTVLAGKHDLDNPHEAGQQEVGVSMIINHYGYNTRTKESDMALLKLQRPVVFNQFVRPIDLWMTPLPVHRKCTITGWGSTRENGPRVNRLQEVNVTILPTDVCNQYYLGRIRSSMFCAGKDGGGADACQGDSGGPLSCFTGSRYELAGLVSWGVGCGRAKRPGVYTKLQQHTPWIYDVMSDQNRVYTDDLTNKEDRCGEQQSSSCDHALGLVGLSMSQDGEVSVENVTESCPFFWPWHVSLQSNGRHYCSGALIHRHWVITAKHCNVRAKEDVVALGVHDLRFSSSQTVPVDGVFNLPQDGSFPPKSDLSLVRLSVPARFNPQVSPVCVPDEDEELDNSWHCVTTGWGAVKTTGDVDPDRLHHVGLTLVNQTTCRQKWGGLVTDSHICSHPAGSTSCMGDSGAPLFCRKHHVYFLFGVVTWGSGRCAADKPSVFTRISDYDSWITEVTEDT